MARLTGRQAGEHILESAMAFADSMLDDEEECFARIEHSLGDGLVSREREVRSAVKRHRHMMDLLSDEPLMESLLAGWVRVCARAERDVQILADAALRKATDSITDELTWAEQTLAERYKGVTVRVMRAVAEETPTIRYSEMASWAATSTRTREELRTLARMQMRNATDVDNLVLRLFSPTPAGLVGFGGRGVWWQVGAKLNAQARHIAIHGSNTLRIHAMDLFNTECSRVE